MAGHNLEGLMKWLGRPEWREVMEEALVSNLGEPLEAFDLDFEALEDVLGEAHLSQVWGCVFEDALPRFRDDGENVVDDYLRRRGFRETATTRAYMTALRDSVFSLHEITEVQRGQGFMARDLVRGGAPVWVSEVSGSKGLKTWDRLAARIVTVGPRTLMGGGALSFAIPQSEALLATLQSLIREGPAQLARLAGDMGLESVAAAAPSEFSPTDGLSIWGPQITSFWLTDLLETLIGNGRPHLINGDGDDIVFTTVVYRLRKGASLQGVRDLLSRQPALRYEPNDFWNWVAPADAQPRVADSPLSGRRLESWMDDGAPVLGTLELVGRRLEFQANSEARAERGRTLLEAALGALVGPPAITSMSPEEMFPTAQDRPEPSFPEPTPEQSAMMHEYLDRHYHGLIDQAVPMLDGRTPREAATSDEGRRLLVAWLKFLENGTEKQPQAGGIDYDFGWMWQQLGVADLRR